MTTDAKTDEVSVSWQADIFEAIINVLVFIEAAGLMRNVSLSLALVLLAVVIICCDVGSRGRDGSLP